MTRSGRGFTRAISGAVAIAFILIGLGESAWAAVRPVSVADYPTIQAAIDANPGQMIFVPNGDYEIERVLTINQAGTGLYGPGRIIQTAPDQAIMLIEKARRVRLQGLTLTRPEGKRETPREGIYVTESEQVELDDIHVLENHSQAATISLHESRDVTVRNCEVRNYKTLALDDRTANPHYGYAFKSIDGTGIGARHCQAVIIEGNRVVETNWVPSHENMKQHGLGTVTVLPPKPTTFMPKDLFETRYTNNWHQGAGIQASGAGSSYTIIRGNYIEHAAQGLDIHGDYVTVEGNIIRDTMIGMKALHGAKHTLISGNQIVRADLWGILLMPGAVSHRAEATSGTQQAQEANTDGGSIIANNIISDFGMGTQHWNWEGVEVENLFMPIALLAGQLPDNPPLRDVIVSANVVYDTGLDQVLVNGTPTVVPPRFRYAVYVEHDLPASPENLHFVGNVLARGSLGVSNIELKP